jgi:hypothetical protein
MDGTTKRRAARVGRAVQPKRRIRPWITQPAVTLLRGPNREMAGMESGRFLGVRPLAWLAALQGGKPGTSAGRCFSTAHQATRVRMCSSGCAPRELQSSPPSSYSPNRKTERWGYPRGESGAGRRAGWWTRRRAPAIPGPCLNWPPDPGRWWRPWRAGRAARSFFHQFSPPRRVFSTPMVNGPVGQRPVGPPCAVRFFTGRTSGPSASSP